MRILRSLLALAGLLFLTSMLVNAQFSTRPAPQRGPARPNVQVEGEQIMVSYRQGAVWSCTIFRMTVPTEDATNPNFPGGYYAPRHCWQLDERSYFYTDDWAFIEKYDKDWDVYAEVGYPQKDGSIEYLESNKVRVRR